MLPSDHHLSVSHGLLLLSRKRFPNDPVTIGIHIDACCRSRGFDGSFAQCLQSFADGKVLMIPEFPSQSFHLIRLDEKFGLWSRASGKGDPKKLCWSHQLGKVFFPALRSLIGKLIEGQIGRREHPDGCQFGCTFRIRTFIKHNLRSLFIRPPCIGSEPFARCPDRNRAS
jgi:hypothetical protein